MEKFNNANDRKHLDKARSIEPQKWENIEPFHSKFQNKYDLRSGLLGLEGHSSILGLQTPPPPSSAHVRPLIHAQICSCGRNNIFLEQSICMAVSVGSLVYVVILLD